MFFKNKFLSENFLLSILGHLFAASFMIVSISFAVKKVKTITKDRVEITEIDLSNVKIAKETELFDIKSEEKKETNKKTQSIKKEEIKDTSFIDESKNVKNKKDDKKTERTIIKVNRQSVNKTMTISVLDALRTSLTRCWVIDLDKFDLSDIRITAHLKMDINKYIRDVWFESASLADTDPAFAYTLETIKSALKTCQPFSILPSSDYDTWKNIILNFYPISGKKNSRGPACG